MVESHGSSIAQPVYSMGRPLRYNYKRPLTLSSGGCSATSSFAARWRDQSASARHSRPMPIR